MHQDLECAGWNRSQIGRVLADLLVHSHLAQLDQGSVDQYGFLGAKVLSRVDEVVDWQHPCKLMWYTGSGKNRKWAVTQRGAIPQIGRGSHNGGKGDPVLTLVTLLIARVPTCVPSSARKEPGSNSRSPGHT